MRPVADGPLFDAGSNPLLGLGARSGAPAGTLRSGSAHFERMKLGLFDLRPLLASTLQWEAMSGLEDLERRVHACEACALVKKRTNAVPGEGSPTADLMFVGEGPGFYEDRDGRPFVGPAGRFLEELLASIGLTRSDVYITNMVKCRPPNNRDPLPGEIEACRPFLDEQMETISPKVIVTLGRYSLEKFFPGELISRAHGSPRPWMNMTLYPIYHPAAALHNPKLRPTIMDDFSRLPSLVESATGRDTGPAAVTEETRQLDLFE